MHNNAASARRDGQWAGRQGGVVRSPAFCMHAGPRGGCTFSYNSHWGAAQFMVVPFARVKQAQRGGAGERGAAWGTHEGTFLQERSEANPRQ